MIDLNPNHLEMVERILAEHVPECEVRAFGSRATWTAKDYSDLDLAVVGEGPIDWGTLGRLKEAFEDSALPMRVDVLDWHSISENFRRHIQHDYVVVQDSANRPLAGERREVPFSLLLSEPVRNGVYKKKEFHGRGVKIVNMGELFANRRLCDVDMRRVELSESERKRFSVQAGDLLFARRSLVAEGAGKCSVVLEINEPTAFESSIIRARPDPAAADSLFLYYYFNSPIGLHALDTIRRQVAVAGITGTDLAQLPVEVPSLPAQRAIAHVLGTLDDKIELNRRMNETLEEMTRALFKSWFVDFDPVRAKMDGRWQRGESLPSLPADLYDLFPDRLTGSELGAIPEGWEVKLLGSVAEQCRDGVKPEHIDPDTPYIGLEHMPKRRISLGDWGVAGGLASGKFRFKRGDILFGKLRPYFHKVGVAALDGVCSTDIVVISPKWGTWFGFVLGHVCSSGFVDYVDAASTGTKMPRTKWADMARYKVVLPDMAVASAFTVLIQPSLDTILSGIHESRSLGKIRDSLLSNLVSSDSVT